MTDVSHDDWDVIVVGARVAGAATAMLLARAGRRVLVLDRARGGSDTLSTHAFMRTGVLQLHRWGLLDRVVASGAPPVRRTVFHHGSVETAVSHKAAFGVEAFYAPRRHVLDAILADAASEAGATVRHGVTVTGLLRGDAGRVCGVTARGRGGRDLRFGAGLVIGADGLRSTVADLVGAPLTHRGTHAGGYLYGYWTNLGSGAYEWFYRPGRSAGVIPTNDGATCVFVGESADRLRDRLAGGTDRGFAALAASVDPDLADRVAAATRLGRLRVFRGHPGYLRRSWGPGWALVGDAGYWKDPISTHGMSDALRDAALLARAARTAEPGSRDQDIALAGYEARRNSLSLPMTDVVDRIAAYDWDAPTIQRLLFELSSTMTDQVEAVAALDLGGAAA